MFHGVHKIAWTFGVTEYELNKIENLVEWQCFYAVAEISANGVEFRVPLIQRALVMHYVFRYQYSLPSANNVLS